MLKKYLLALAVSAIIPLTAHANEAQVRCLAQNAYHEAGSQGTSGMEAVTNVVINRTKDKRFPSTPCAVIKQRYKKSCQFSWVCTNKQIKNKALYDKAVVVVRRVYYNMTIDNTNGALYFHERHAKPSWASRFRLTMKIGDHKFYRG